MKGNSAKGACLTTTESAIGPEPSDPAERTDQRREALGPGDVQKKRDGNIEQHGHGSMDESLLRQGKDHPEKGPYVPEHDHVDPNVESDAPSHPKGKTDIEHEHHMEYAMNKDQTMGWTDTADGTVTSNEER